MVLDGLCAISMMLRETLQIGACNRNGYLDRREQRHPLYHEILTTSQSISTYCAKIFFVCFFSFCRASPTGSRWRKWVCAELFAARVPSVGKLETHTGRNTRRTDEGPTADPQRTGQLHPASTTTGQYINIRLVSVILEE